MLDFPSKSAITEDIGNLPLLFRESTVRSLGAGETGEAQERLPALQSFSAGHYVPQRFLAMAHFALGKIDLGFEQLRNAVDSRESMVRSLKERFDWDPFRSDPRFEPLLRRVWP